jgi:type II secretory pathway component PulF
MSNRFIDAEIAMSESSNENLPAGRLTGAETAELSRQIAGLAQAGLPLADGLIAVGEELPAGRLRRSMNRLAKTLESGVPLDQALEMHRESIPPHLRGLVIAGLRSGRLGDILSRFAQYLSVGTELKRRLWLSLAYPIMTASAALALFVFFCLVLVSQFESMYKNFGIPLPRMTIALLAVARALNMAWFPVALVVGTLFCGWLAATLFLSPSSTRALAGRLPLVGTVWRATSLAEFCHLLALLLESRLPMPEALRLTGEGVQDADVDSSCRVMASQVEVGRSLSQAMEQARLFPLGLPHLVRWAENQESLPEVLHMAGAMFESRGRSYSTFVGTALNVLCVLLVFTMVLVIPALFLPFITLISRLSG